MKDSRSTKKGKIENEVEALAYIGDKLPLLKNVIAREVNLMKAESQMDQLNRYNELCNNFPCPLRYFDEVPLCKDNKSGPCSECELRKILVK